MYKLNLEATSLPELATLVKSHHEELQKSMGTYQTTLSNIVAASSHLPAAPIIPPTATTAGSLPPVTDNSADGVDAEGLPYDARIHSSSKKKTANGTWARRKNVDEGIWNSVRAELFARGNGNTGFSGNIPVQPTAPIPPAPIIAATAPANPMPTMNDVPAFLRNQHGAGQMPPVAPVTQMPPAAPAMATPAYTPPPAAPMPPAATPAAAAGGSFADLFGRVQQMLANGSIDVAYLNSLTQRLSQRWSVQVNAINDISNRPDMVADAFAILAVDGK